MGGMMGTEPIAMDLRIAGWREYRNMTQRELAQHSGVALTTINEIETGKRRPRPSTLRRIASALSTDDWNLYKHPKDSMGGAIPEAAMAIEEDDVPDPPQRFNFEIVHTAAPEAGPVVVRSVVGADEATLAFAAELGRLQAERARGELAIRPCHDGRRLLLRLPLSAGPPVRGTPPVHPWQRYARHGRPG